MSGLAVNGVAVGKGIVLSGGVADYLRSGYCSYGMV